jgi:hypothetical protein
VKQFQRDHKAPSLPPTSCIQKGLAAERLRDVVVRVDFEEAGFLASHIVNPPRRPNQPELVTNSG